MVGSRADAPPRARCAGAPTLPGVYHAAVSASALGATVFNKLTMNR